jgi:hypothetical protein
MIQAILATDMSMHFSLLGKFEQLVKANPTNGLDKVTTMETKKLLGCILLKCADISNVVKPFPIAKNWAEILCREFFMQGDIERSKGMDVSPLMDRDSVVMPQMQLGFINSICVPIYTLLSTLIPDLQITLNTLKDNITEWNKILQLGMNKARAV